MNEEYKAKLFAKVKDRPLAKQIEHCDKLSKCADDNPDLSLPFIKEILLGAKQIQQGQGTPYNFSR